VELETRRATYRYESRWLSLIARYAIVFVGILLATSFATSVRYDDADIARAAWQAGGELLGTFGVIAGLALPLLGSLTALTRRGRKRRLHLVALRPDALVLHHAAGRLELPWTNLRGGHVQPLDDERVRVSLELAGGLRTGDGIELVGERALGEVLRDRLEAAPARHDLATRSLRYGAAMWSLASVGGTIAGLSISEELWRRIVALPGPLANLAWGEGWALGLVVACIGALRLALQLASITPSIVLGADGVLVERLFGSRFVPFGSIRAVHTSVLGLRLELHAGRSVRAWSLGMSLERATALAQAIRAQVAESGAPLPTLPRIGEAATGAWADEVVHHATTSDYRRSPPSDDDLVRALEGPGTSGELRVAAAVALRARHGGESARARIRIAAKKLADEDARALLERVAEEEADVVAIEAALSERTRRA
jgi:hypothetical protein